MTAQRKGDPDAVPVTATLAAWLARLPQVGIPREVSGALRLLTLDTLGAAAAGGRQEWTQVVAQWAKRGALPPAAGLASIWGERQPSLRPSEAALVNGTAAHAFELDDFHNAKLHPGAVVIPAVLAVAEARGIDGPRIETAIAAGYEVMIRTSLALDPSEARLRGWHLTAVCGTLGAAAAVAVLLGLDAQRTAWALGLAGTQSGGLFAFNADGTMSKRLHPGRAAQSGIMAAELAELGLTGPTKIYEAQDGGLLWAFSAKSRVGPLVDGLGKTWHAANTSFKPYSCCGSLHSYVDAAIALRAKWKPGARVRTGVAEVVNLQCGYLYAPGSQLNAQMSIRYCTAVALLDGAALPAQFTPERIADPELTKLAQSIEVVHDPAQDALYPARYAAWIELETAPGANAYVREDRLDPSGHPSNPGREAALRSKFRGLAEGELGGAAAADLSREIDGLDRTSARRIIELMAHRA
jgi:2-methylcitrate dehydratase PrpD